MKNKKKITIAAVSVAAAAVIVTSGIYLWRKNADSLPTDDKAFVSLVSDNNTALSFSLAGNCFSGVVESQKTLDVKYDTDKKIKDILVKEGDTVEEGTELFTYDVDAMELEHEQGELEIEKYKNDIASMKKQITQLENDKKNASSDEQFSYSTQIQSLQTDISKAEYDIKVKNSELEKLENSIKNSTVKSEMAGIVKKVNSTDSGIDDNIYGDMYGGTSGSADVVMTIIADGDFRIKGTINEQNMMAMAEQQPVIVRSRVDENVTWTGSVSEISTEPEQNNNNYYGIEEDESLTSSKYSFYVTLDSIDGLMLGQHVIIEPDYGQSNAIEKSGIWLLEDYIITDDDGKTFVWAADNKDRLEKRYIDIGQKDEMFGDCEIVSGLKDSDYIAYPSDDYVEGMSVTTNYEDIEIPDEDIGFDENIDGGDVGIFDENGNPIDDEDVIFDENGNIVNGSFADGEDIVNPDEDVFNDVDMIQPEDELNNEVPVE